MEFSPPLTPGHLEQRYKRFLADITLEDGNMVTAHVANPGAMLGLDKPGARVLMSRSDNPKRTLAWSWELVEATPIHGGAARWVGVNTAQPNRLVAEALGAGRLAPFREYAHIRICPYQD